MNKREIRLAVLKNMKEVGEAINNHLKDIRNNNEEVITNVELSRFSNGEGKAILQNSVRDKDVYILSDVGNYGDTYKMHGRVHEMSPDEHFQDIKRVISAMGGNADKIHLIMPLLYQSRQHKRNGRESLDCAIALQELESMGVHDIITVDAHDPNVSNAIPKMPFENFYPTNIILNSLISREEENMDNLLVISPDMGAMERARYYAEVLGCDVGAFYKRRDLSRVVNGKNPIVDHVYLGTDVRDKNVIVVDDMIASGNSMLEVAYELKNKGARKIYFASTFAFFTEGYDKFIKAWDSNYFDKLYSTNLSYVPDFIKNQGWYQDVDCSLFLARIINSINKGSSLEEYHKPSKEILCKVKDLRK